jgi:predicted TIM-barrel fold metal-dependent hydrolase
MAARNQNTSAMISRRSMLKMCAAGAAAMGFSKMLARGENPMRTAIDFDIPPGACDCHVHIFNPQQFPFAERRVYTPPPATVDQLLQLQGDLHLSHVVIVQPSIYGIDNTCTLDALRQLGPRARGIAVIDPSIPRDALVQMNEGGIRGVRLNLEVTTDAVAPDAAKKLIAAVAEKIAGLGWHLQLLTRPALIAAIKGELHDLPFPIVFDHFAGADPREFASQPGFDSLLELLKSGRCYVKISGAYRASKERDLSDMPALAKALIQANSDRIVWGTDWPHPDIDRGRGKPLSEITPPLAIDDGFLMNQLQKWAPEAAVRKKILVDNPARLYGFSPQ